jgi:hypothetical protein
MDSSNLTNSTYTSPSCQLDVQTKQAGLPNLSSLAKPKAVGFSLHLDDTDRNTPVGVSVNGNPQQLEKLQKVVNSYVQQLVSEFPMEQQVAGVEDTMPLTDSSRVLDADAAPDSNPLSLTNVSKLLDRWQNEEPTKMPQAPAKSSFAKQTGINITPGDRPLSHQLHLGDLAKNGVPRTVTLSSLQLFDLSSVLEAYAVDKAMGIRANSIDAPAPTIVESEDTSAELSTSDLTSPTEIPVGERIDGHSTEAALSRLPNLPKLSNGRREPDYNSSDYATTVNYSQSGSGIMSAIPWAAAAAVAVGAPLLLLGPSSNSLKELTGKVKMPEVKMPDVKMPNVKAPDLKMPTIGSKPTTTNPADPTNTAPANAGTTPGTAWQPQPVTIPAGSTAPSPNPTVSPAAQNAGISVGSLPAGMGDKSSLDLDREIQKPAAATQLPGDIPTTPIPTKVKTTVPTKPATVLPNRVAKASQPSTIARPVPNTNVPGINSSMPPIAMPSGAMPPVGMPMIPSAMAVPKTPVAKKIAKAPLKPIAAKPIAKAPSKAKVAKKPLNSVIPNLPAARPLPPVVMPGGIDYGSEIPDAGEFPNMGGAMPANLGTYAPLPKPAAKKAPKVVKQVKPAAKPVAKPAAAKPAKSVVALKPKAKPPALKPVNMMGGVDTPTSMGQEPQITPKGPMPVDPKPMPADGFPSSGVPGGIDPNPTPQVAANNAGVDPFDTPSIREAKNYLQSKWKGDAKQPVALQIVVQVSGKDGTVKKIEPQGAAAQDYLKQSGSIQVGQKLVSPQSANGNDQRLRAILSPNGTVEVIAE